MENVTWVVKETCIDFPPRVNSPGWLGIPHNSNHFDQLMEYSGPRLLFQMVVILIISQLLHFILKRLNFPAFLSHIIAGIIVGQTLLKSSLPKNAKSPELWLDNVQVMETLASFGYMFFLFLNGVKVDPTIIHKSGHKPFCIGVSSLVIPIALDLGLHLKNRGNIITTRSFFMTITYSMTSFPVIHSLLSEFKLLNSELGRLALSSAIVSDLLSLILMIANNLLELGILNKHATTEIIKNIGLNLAFILGTLVVLRCGLKLLLRHTNREGTRVKHELFYFIVILYLLSPYLARYCKIFMAFGPYLFGLAIPEGPPLGSALIEKFNPLVSGYAVMLFTAAFVAKVDLNALFISLDSYMKAQITSAVTTVVFKFGVVVILPLLYNMPVRDSIALGIILCTKGVVELATYGFMSENLLISREMLAFNTILVVIIGSMGPMLLMYVYDQSQKFTSYQKQSIMNIGLKDELRILACIHVPANVTSTTNLLNNWQPKKDNPLKVDVLHLVKLQGQATPLFIAHQKKGKVAAIGKSYSENVVLAFDHLERQSDEAITTNVFTAVSPILLMHEDICNLALDNLTSFIILPFHRRRFIDGTIESEDSAIRNINCNILEKSPCSVGILIDGKSSFATSPQTFDHLSQYKVAMIFLGGGDDLEALMLAKRFTQDLSTKLTVFHLKKNDTSNVDNRTLNHVYDDEVLKVMAKDDQKVSFVEQEVSDGPETSDYLRSVVNQFDLVIVGRRYNVEDEAQTQGLKEWSEFPELGVIGDLLASEDFNGQNSILIVQQQRTFHK